MQWALKVWDHQSPAGMWHCFPDFLVLGKWQQLLMTATSRSSLAIRLWWNNRSTLEYSFCKLKSTKNQKWVIISSIRKALCLQHWKQITAITPCGCHTNLRLTPLSVPIFLTDKDCSQQFSGLAHFLGRMSRPTLFLLNKIFLCLVKTNLCCHQRQGEHSKEEQWMYVTVYIDVSASLYVYLSQHSC